MPVKELLKKLRWFGLRIVFDRWRHRIPPVEGYTILLPSPMDMPFLLRFALEGLWHLDTSNCRQIIVIPDGYGSDRGAALQKVVDSCGDSRVELARLRPAADFFVHRIGDRLKIHPEWVYWAMVVEGINRATSEYIFLQDADAFLLESDGLERQYRECRDRGMLTLGVLARWDPFFREIGYTIPGTYELMFSASWIRNYRPLDIKGQNRETAYGSRAFDTLLYPQFRDYASGKIGVLEPPMRLLHFNGAITKYRLFLGGVGQQRIDENYRILFLALMEDLIPSPGGERLLPSVIELARGLDDASAAISYCSPKVTRDFPTFRAMIEDLCNSPLFRGPRGDQIRASMLPFDRYYENLLTESGTGPADRLRDDMTEPGGVRGSELAGKRLKLLTDLVPGLARLAVLSNPSNPSHGLAIEQLQDAAKAVGVDLGVARVLAPNVFESAFATVIAGRADALLVLSDGMLFDNYNIILAFADFNLIPVLFSDKEIARAGGLAAFGPSRSTCQTCLEPDASVLELDKSLRLDLAINIKTAKILGLAVPTALLALADEVIE